MQCVPGARSFHRRDTHLRALKKRVEKRVSQRICCAGCALPKDAGPNCELKSRLELLSNIYCPSAGGVGQEGAT